MSEENEGVSEALGNSNNRLSSIMDLDYEPEKKLVPENEVEPDDKKPAPSNEPAKEKVKANAAKTDKPDKKESESEEETEEEEEVEEEEEEEKVESEKKKLKYKVDGEEIEGEFSDEDLSSAVSAKAANLKRLNELNVERKKIGAENTELKDTVEYVKKEMHGIRGSFEKDIEAFKKNGVVSGNPLAPIYKLLDNMGLDTASFDKAALFYFLPMAEKFSALSDEGRDLFLSRHENEWHKRKQATLKEQETQIAETRRKSDEENSALRQANLSTEQASELREELSEMGIKDITTKKVIEWHQVKPSYLRAQGIAQKVPGTNVNKIARVFIDFPDTTDEEILEQLGHKELEKKNVGQELAQSKPKTTGTKPKSKDKIEEEVDKMFGKMFRR